MMKMNSPITGKEMALTYEWRKVTFRKEEFEIPYQLYQCEDSKEQFTTTALDELNLKWLHHQYRSSHHIPTQQEIIETREMYDLSAVKMSDILGFGANTYRLYESGDVPGIPNANLIKLASDPVSFKKLVQEWTTDNQKAKEDLLGKINRLISEQEQKQFELDFGKYLMGSPYADLHTGYSKPDINVLTEMIVYFSHEVSCYKTKMNKLLFYADFLHFRTYGHSISGARYKAIPYGPVPENFESIYERLVHEDIIDGFYKKENNSLVLKGREDRPFNQEKMTDEETHTLRLVVDKFRDTNVSKIVEVSHQEPAWKNNHETNASIAYHYALELRAV